MRSPRHFWQEWEVGLLLELYPHVPTFMLASELGRPLHKVYNKAKRMGLAKTKRYLASKWAQRLRRDDNPGIAYRYPKGHVPANKGLKRPGWAPGRMASTQFKKGNPTHRWMPIGSTRLVDRYVYRKVSDIRCVPWTRNWRQEHYLVWEQHNGPIPKGHIVGFKDRDRMNVAIDNLECITLKENMLRNTIHNLPSDLVEVIQLNGAIRRRITLANRKRTHENEGRGSPRTSVRDAGSLARQG